MAVIVKDMDMPDCCMNCPFRLMDYMEFKVYCRRTREHVPLYKTKRGDECPLSEAVELSKFSEYSKEEVRYCIDNFQKIIVSAGDGKGWIY